MQASDDTPNDPADPGEGPTRRVDSADPGDGPTRRVDPDDSPTVRGLAPERRVFGRYVLESLVGRGGMGVVWRARDKRKGRSLLVAGLTALTLGILAYALWPRSRSVSANQPVGPDLASGPSASANRPEVSSGHERQSLDSMAASAKRADAALTAGFAITVDPPDVGARLWLGPLSDVEIKDGKALLKDLPDGEQELTVQATGYQPFTTRVTVKDGRGSVEAKLVPVRGEVTVTARPGAHVTAVDERGRETRLGSVPAGGVLDVANLLTAGRYTEEGQAWTVPELNLEMAYIRPGAFTMGSENGDSDEKPLTRVTLTKGYWLGKTEVTQGQWEALMGTTVVQQRDKANRGWPLRGESTANPIYYVSWDDAMQFCRKLTERERQAGRLPEGYEYTLPTEAQWEYACRAGTTGDYAGNLDGMAWYNQNSGNTTHPAAQKQANAWGLYDMHGNVWEWCRDWSGDYPGGSVTDPTGPPSGSNRGLRGGCWDGIARYCRSASRSWIEPGNRYYHVGFRLALSSTMAANRTAEVSAALEKLRGAEEGQAWTVPELNLEMAYIRPGTFTMGSPDSEEGRFNDESPQTRVTLTKGYWLGKTEVTQGQYEALMGSNPSNFKNAGIERGARRAGEACLRRADSGRVSGCPSSAALEVRAGKDRGVSEWLARSGDSDAHCAPSRRA